MTGQTLILRDQRIRDRAAHLCQIAPDNAVVNFRESTRSSEQNDKMWAMLSDVARAKPEGREYPAEIWKCLFMAECGHQCRFEPSLDGRGVVPIGFKSSRLRKAEFSDLIEAIYAYGSEHGVIWSEPNPWEQAA
jgi:hypothetical protein